MAKAVKNAAVMGLIPRSVNPLKINLLKCWNWIGFSMIIDWLFPVSLNGITMGYVSVSLLAM